MITRYLITKNSLQIYIISNAKQYETACMYYLVILLWNRLNTDWFYGFFSSFFLYPPFLPPYLSFFLYLFFMQLLKGQVPSWNSWPLLCHLLCLKNSCPGLQRKAPRKLWENDWWSHSLTVCPGPPETRVTCLSCSKLSLQPSNRLGTL